MRFAALVLAFALLGANARCAARSWWRPRLRRDDRQFAGTRRSVRGDNRSRSPCPKSDLVAARIAVTTGKEQHLAGFDFARCNRLRRRLPTSSTSRRSCYTSRRNRHCCRYRPTISGTHRSAATVSSNLWGVLNYALTASNAAPLGYAGQVGYNFPKVLLTSTMFSDAGLFRRGQTYIGK